MRRRGPVPVLCTVITGLLLVSSAQPVSADPHPDWGTLTLTTSGAAGDWVFAYHGFDPDVTTFEGSVSFHLEVDASSPGSTVMYMLPELVWLHDGDLRAPFMEPAIETSGPGQPVSVSHDYSYRASISGASFGGIMFLAAATAPWTLTVTIERTDGGPTNAPDMLTTGSEMTTVAGEDDQLDLPIDPAGTVRLEASLEESGWNHLQVEFHPIQPDGVRDYDIRFPGGTGWTGFGYGYGAQTPLLGYSHRAGKIDFVGEMADTDGILEATIQYAEATYDLDLRLVHLPGFTSAALPADWTGTLYVGFDSPFYDGLAPLPPEEDAPVFYETFDSA